MLLLNSSNHNFSAIYPFFHLEMSEIKKEGGIFSFTNESQEFVDTIKAVFFGINDSLLVTLYLQ